MVEKVKARERTKKESMGKRKIDNQASRLAKKVQRREIARAELGDDEDALAKLEAAAEKEDHKSAACSANWWKKAEEGRRCRKVVIYPDAKQAALLRVWFDAVRCIKNMTVEYVNATHEYDLKVVRGAMGLEKGGDAWRCLPARFEDVPRDVLDQAVRDCHKDCNSRLAQLERKVSRIAWARHFKAMRKRGDENIEKPERDAIKKEIKAEVARLKGAWTFSFHRKKDASENMMLSNRYLDRLESKSKRYKDNAKFVELFGGPDNRGAMKTTPGQPLPVKFKCDCRLVHEKRLGRSKGLRVSVALMPKLVDRHKLGLGFGEDFDIEDLNYYSGTKARLIERGLIDKPTKPKKAVYIPEKPKEALIWQDKGDIT